MTWRRAALMGGVVATLAVACAAQDDPEAHRRAVELVEATKEAGIAKGLTVDTAVALYGDDATTFCDVQSGGLDSIGGHVAIGNAAQGRRTTITDEAVEYGRLLTEIYCPNVDAKYEDTVTRFDPFMVTER